MLQPSVCRATIGALLLVLAGLPAASQVPTTELRLSRCERCELRFGPPTILYEGGEEYGGVSSGLLVQDSRGRFYVRNATVRSTLLLFDSAGNFMRTIGRSGSGPGEFEGIYSVVVGAGDSLYVFDQDTDNSYTLIGPDYDVVYKRQLPGRLSSKPVPLAPGRVVLNGWFSTSAHFGYPLHLMEDGRLAGPIGPDVLRGRPTFGHSSEFRRAVARASDSTFWVADGVDYTIDLMTIDGRVLRRLRRTPEWYTIEPTNTPAGVLNPAIRAMDVDANGLLWVLVQVRAHNWRDVIREVAPPTDRHAFITSSTGNPGESREVVLEVIDLTRGEVILSKRYDWRMKAYFVAPGKMYAEERDAVGRTRTRVWDVQLLRGGNDE